MAMHVFVYRLKCLLRDKEALFWTLAFPILLATLFYFAFGQLMGDHEGFQPVPAAVVDSTSYQMNIPLRQMLEALATPGNGQMLELTVAATDEEAQMLLDDAKIVGFISVGEGSLVRGGSAVRLTVAQSGLRQSILKAILDEYAHTFATVSSIMLQNPTALSGLISQIGTRLSYTRQISYSNAAPDTMLSYFFALIAMACLYGGFWGMRNSIDVQADLSPQGARRSVAPTHKLAVVVSDFAAGFVVHLAELLVLLAYLVFVLKVDLGDQTGYVLLATIAGCVTGVSFGTLVGTLFRKSEGVKNAALIGGSMLMSFLAGLMFVNMKDIIARTMPVLSYINPAALITDAFYSLYVFENHDRFFLNLGLLMLISAAMCFASFLQLRGEKYASL